MAGYTKGKLKVDGNVYIKGEQGEMVAGTAHVAGLPVEEQKANAKELVRRWNAFEKGGSQPALLDACEELYKISAMIGGRITLAGTSPQQIDAILTNAKAAIAEGGKE